MPDIPNPSVSESLIAYSYLRIAITIRSSSGPGPQAVTLRFANYIDDSAAARN